ncbi:hypothetical protein [Aliivibrio sifiae]|uniref:hypothetical protein n=1 Tax=Aliivibrio sifiae TaxID=566293 RepID=UPI003D0E09B1
MNKISVSEILDFSGCLDDEDPNDTFHKSYYYFLKYFSQKDVITEEDLIIGANFTYGWMPTMMRFKSEDFELSVSILNKAKSEIRISSQELMVLKGLINNSLVGASKLLHFINPEKYAIWDSRVCNFLVGKSYKYIVEKIDLYWEYLDLCERVSKDPHFLSIHDNFSKVINYKVYPFRTIEQIMFINSSTPIAKF